MVERVEKVKKKKNVSGEGFLRPVSGLCQHLNIRAKIIMLLEENAEINDLGFGDGFLAMTPKA